MDAKVKQEVIKLISEEKIYVARAYLCVELGYSPKEAEEIIYDLI